MHRQEFVLPITYIYYPILAALQVPINLVAIVILYRGKCGLSKCITRYLVAMAAADLMVVIFDVICYRTGYIYFASTVLNITPVCRVNIVLFKAATDCSVWFTVAFTFDRFTAICCQKLKAMFCTEQTAVKVIGTFFTINCLTTIGIYFSFGPRYVINNVSWGCIHTESFNLLLGWKIYAYIIYFWNPLLPFLLILLFNALTIRHILVSSKGRVRLQAGNIGGKRKDSEMESRKKSIILLFAVSGSFILLWMTYVVNGIYGRISKNYYYSGFNDPLFVRQEVGIMLQLFSCGTNTCIYAVSQRKFREELRNGVVCQFAQLLKVIALGKH
ncbi:probable G-protein coupled receptor 139 [Callorhinchus milii]|uniref:probable G-protein coupled receptor 139 n=1 Tax=Callorhinchus milii TaxID=7868 RepID=UPI001C3FECE9|nr:probable G-protein coupled receptor 139 [Callorhinchus milii]